MYYHFKDSNDAEVLTSPASWNRETQVIRFEKIGTSWVKVRKFMTVAMPGWELQERFRVMQDFMEAKFVEMI